jgi:hypothetical protein
MNRYRFGIAVLLALALVTLAGCFGDPPSYRYKGDYPDLNSEATNSLLGVYGMDYNTIAVVDEDSYGRRLYVYCGRSAAANDQIARESPFLYGILVSQKSDDEYVYYYPDDNFILFKGKYEPLPTVEDLVQYSTDPAVAADAEQLKLLNDWGQPINDQKCAKAKISIDGLDNEAEQKRKAFVSEETRDALVAHMNVPEGYSVSPFYYLTSDADNRHIYFFRIIKKAEQSEDSEYQESYVVLFNEDGSFDPEDGIMEIKDVWHYQDDLKAFKERNGWNTPR